MAAKRRSRQAREKRPLHARLALFDFLLGQLGFSKFEKIAALLRNVPPEDDRENTSRFCRALCAALPAYAAISTDELAVCDINITRHTAHIGHKRGGIQWKYFQYLILLFAELYLRRYFDDKEGLLRGLNKHCQGYSSEFKDLTEYTADDIKKIALWSATGSGKTLLMHVNLLQFRHYAKKAGRKKHYNREILLAPNESMAKQHLEEMKLSSIQARILSKTSTGNLLAGTEVEIMSIHKLREEAGKETIAVESFENNNIVLIDEGHRGAGGEVWRNMREALCQKGFSFEYSATFGQIKESLQAQYAKNIWFDYSYYRFYHDGYGKDYRIHNLRNESFADENHKRLYLTACLLVFYRQLHKFQGNPATVAQFNIAAPLWVFVGSRVTQKEYENPSDVLEVVRFLRNFIHNKEVAKKDIDAVVSQSDALLDNNGRPLFAGTFDDLQFKNADEIYSDIYRKLFNAENIGELRLAKLGDGGEIALFIGANEPFGLINIGDVNKFMKTCQEELDDAVVDDRHFAESFFATINRPDSRINILIGAKKFTEGWNSWRVSTMGLMNVGKSEGVQIIQLFGRGVRLKGYDEQLQRRGFAYGDWDKTDTHSVDVLETLNVFGLRADFMQHFRAHLEREGLQVDRETIIIPTVKNLDGAKLKIIRVKKSREFKREKTFAPISPNNQNAPNIRLDWRAKVGVMDSSNQQDGIAMPAEDFNIPAAHKAFFNHRQIYDELQEFKAAKRWHNLRLPRGIVSQLLDTDHWYRLYIAKDNERFDGFDSARHSQEIAIVLMQKYLNACCKNEWASWEGKNRRYEILKESDPNMIAEYQILVKKSENTLINNLELLRKKVYVGDVPQLLPRLGTFMFERHLYQPLLHIDDDCMAEIKPHDARLNKGEAYFFSALRQYFKDSPAFFTQRKLYLLRNRSRGRGVGFFEANNFHPDFIMWLLDETTKLQHIAFVEPKGLHNLAADDKKIKFFQTIKEIEKEMQTSAPEVRLNSFIIAQTKFENLINFPGQNEEDLLSQNIILSDDNTHISKMFKKITTAEITD